MSSIVPALIQVCTDEWSFFRRSEIRLDGSTRVGLREYDDGAWQRIGDYWQFIGGGYKNLTGMDRGVPWSAAFISWCMHAAGAGASFPYSAGHSHYINAAIKAKGDAEAALVAHEPAGYQVRVGDLIGYWRGEQRISVANARKIGWYESHTEIVVDVEGNTAYSIGGNVMHSVTRRQVRLNSKGELADRTQNWFVVIENEVELEPAMH